MKAPITKVFISLVTLLLLIVLTLPAVPLSADEGQVNLVIKPANKNVSQNETFTVTVEAQCDSQTTDGIDVFLNFDPDHLEVQSSQKGTALTMELKPASWDNTAGTFGFGAGQLSAPFPSGTFDVISITFKALNTTPSFTPITFNTSGARTTMVDWLGNDITGSLAGSNVMVTADAPICLDPPESVISGGQVFDIAIKTNVGSSQQVSGVEVYLNFDPLLLEVVSVVPGATLPNVLQNTYDNVLGLVSYSAGDLISPFPSGSFTVATVQFAAKEVASDIATLISISLAGDYVSAVDCGGTLIAGTHGDATVELISGIAVDISVELQGGLRPESGWIVPVTVKLFPAGTNDVLSAVPLHTFNLTTSKNGNTATATTPPVSPGTYDMTIVSPHCLTNVKRAVSITALSSDINMGVLLEGNANDDNKINISDFGILSATYGKQSGQQGFDARADFDRSGKVTISDFGLLATNYGKNAPITVP